MHTYTVPLHAVVYNRACFIFRQNSWDIFEYTSFARLVQYLKMSLVSISTHLVSKHYILTVYVCNLSRSIDNTNRDLSGEADKVLCIVIAILNVLHSSLIKAPYHVH